jgi:hypothetical protein
VRIAAGVLGAFVLLAIGVALWLRPMVAAPPVFTIEHTIEFPGTPAEVWSVFMDAEHYGEWNPYLLERTGEPVVGGEIQIAILQRNWDEPMRLAPRLTEVAPPVQLAWRGELWPPGLLRTDHSFHIAAVGPDRVRFVQREAFRGRLAELFDEEAKGHTAAAFRAMDEALARRVDALRTANATP